MAVNKRIIILAGPDGAGKTALSHHYKARVDTWVFYDNGGPEPVLLEFGENT